MKRPFDGEGYSQHSFRQPKQRDYHGNLTLNAEEYHITTMAVHSPGKIRNMTCYVFMNLCVRTYL